MATSGHPKVLLNNVSATTTGTRQHCSVNFGQGEVFQACTTFYADVQVVSGSPTFTLVFQGEINEQDGGVAFPAPTAGSTAALTGLTASGQYYWKLPTTGTTGGPFAVTWWSCNLTLTSGSGVVRVVGISAS
jgi:hypothetical protein